MTRNVSVVMQSALRVLEKSGLFLCLLICSQLSQGGTVIRTAAQTDTAPKYIASSDPAVTTVVGMCVDIDRALERADPSLQFVGDQNWIPASRVDIELTSGALDSACAISKTASRLENLQFIDPPLFSSEYVLIARANDAVAIRNWQDVQALGSAGMILMDHGFGPVERLKKMGLKVDDGALGVKNNLLKLRLKRGRFYYHRRLGLDDDIKRSGMASEVRILPLAMEVQPFYLVFGHSASPEMVNQVRRALERLVASGELKRIVRTWSEPGGVPSE